MLRTQDYFKELTLHAKDIMVDYYAEYFNEKYLPNVLETIESVGYLEFQDREVSHIEAVFKQPNSFIILDVLEEEPEEEEPETQLNG